MTKSKVLSLLVLLLGISMNAQDLLEKQGAVDIALDNNYDIKVSNNDLEAAKNSSSIYNSGYLPSVFANGGADYQSNESEIEFQNGTVQDDIENTTNSVNASVGIDYLIFDGFGRKYNYKKLQEQYNISEIRVRQVIENTLLDLLIAYYDVALLTENKSNLEQSLAISKSQLLREQYGYQYGQKTQLDVLNSEVNVNQDSINLLNIQRELANAKRDLNVILGRNVNIDFQVDTTVTYAIDLTYENMLQSAKLNNTLLLQAEKNVTLSDYDLKINKSSWVPNVGINGAYNWRDSNTDSNISNPFLLASQTSRGIVGGLTVSWNIFDGGQTKTRVQNAKIAIDNSNIEKELIEKDLERNVANAWETYQNSLFVLSAEEKNVETNRQNFLRSEEQFKLGQIITVEFRLAQVNFLSAINSYNQAKYTAKVAELRLLQLGGKLIGANY
ncbi:MAG: TolC family protein [Flavobacteriaceae bacterium]|nr:MAG: TolC family protein [Flavobacteriaceae bacterium]